jgi:hypothetical protein
MEEENSNFLINAINDTQNVIRAVDTKIQILFALLAIPTLNIGEIIPAAKALWNASCYSIPKQSLVIAFYGLWIIAVYIAFKCLSGIGSPIGHIKGDKSLTGVFYLGDEFTFSWKNCFRNGRVISKNSIDEILKKLPKSKKEVLDELMFELIKVVYIRDLKLFRQRWVFRISLTWIILGGLMFTLQ